MRPREVEANNATREVILRLIRERPGIHKSGLRRASGLGWGTVTHHLRVLEAQRLIRTALGAGKLRLFPAATPTRQLGFLAALHDALPREILRHLDQEPRQGIQELSRRCQVSRKIIRRHLTALGEAGLVERSQDYRPRFRVLPRPEGMAESRHDGLARVGPGGAGPG